MNLEYFIAKRLISAKDYKSSISAPIIKIAISAIAIGMIMMIVSVATGMGLQQKIREKISAFNGHIIISNYDTLFERLHPVQDDLPVLKPHLPGLHLIQ